MKHTHSAYNITTGEIITTSSVNALKKHVAIVNHYDKKHSYFNNKWVFAHGGNALEKVCKKALQIIESQN